MPGVVVFSSNEESKYYEQSNAKMASVFVLGDSTESLTNNALEHLKRNGVSVFLFPWSKIPNLRLQLELTRYPVVQLWREGKLIRELSGYKEDDLDDLIETFYITNKR